MAYRGYSQDAPQNNAAQIRPGLSHKASTLSDNPYDEHLPRLSGRESLVSLDSYYASPPLGSLPHNVEHSRPGGYPWTSPFTGASSGRYEPVSAPSSSLRDPGRRQTLPGRSRDSLVEDESYDMSLLKAAAPFGVSSTYAAVAVDEPVTGGPGEPVFDMTSFSGPMSSQDQEFLRKLQEQEASGKLTGGLGLGISPDTRIKSDELLATSPTLKRSFSRSLSLRRKPSTQTAAIKGLGQDAANKTGEVIEVIMEEPEETSEVDLSSMTGPSPVGLDHNNMRRSTLPAKQHKTETFYPQPNWKPFTMRWPYLLSLIMISMVLAISQEVLYQKSANAPLLRFQKPTDIKPFDYFAIKFLPTIVTVTYGVLWAITDFEVKRLEAFYQMSKEGGALAAESINVDYITNFNFFFPFRAIQRKQYAVAVSSITTLLAVSLVPTLGSAAIVLNPDIATRHANANIEKTITVSPVLSRLLTSTFVIIAALGSVLFYQLQSRRSGLLADVKGIAGIASMAVVSHIMMDFKDMDVAKPKDIHRKLKYHRYVLRNSSLAPDDATPMTTQESDRYREAHLSENPHPLMLRAVGCIPFIIGIALFLALIPIFLFTGASAITDKAPWVVTALAVCIKLGWGSLETNIRMMEPYYILSKRHAPARTLTLDYTAMPFAWVAFRALLNKHWTVFFVGFGTVMSEFLTIFVTSLATVEGKDFIDQFNQVPDGPHGPDQELNSGQETVLSFVVSLSFTAFILLYMFIVATIIFIRRRHPFLPRQPNTIASVLAFMHQSKMLYDFVGTAKFTNAQMVKKLEDIGKTYGLGWFEGRDGETHCGVDEEELTGNYKHGIDYSQGNKPWDREWQLF